jgi:hypothetical protein
MIKMLEVDCRVLWGDNNTEALVVYFSTPRSISTGAESAAGLASSLATGCRFLQREGRIWHFLAEASQPVTFNLFTIASDTNKVCSFSLRLMCTIVKPSVAVIQCSQRVY